jgi:Ca2+-binding RTX toxin-like protein
MPVLAGEQAWIEVKALVPVTGFYGDSQVDFEVTATNLAAPISDSVTSTWIAEDNNLQVSGGYVGDPDLLDPNFSGEYRDYDGESTGTKYGAGDTVPYRIRFQNPMHPTDPTGVAHGLTIEFNIPTDAAGDYETQFQVAGVTATGGLTDPSCIIDSDNGTDQDWICSFDGAVPIDGTAIVTLPLLLVDGIDFGGGGSAMEFDVETANSTIDSYDDPEEETYASADACELSRFFGRTHPMGDNDEGSRYQMFGTASAADIESGNPIRFELPCVEPEASPPGSLTNFSSTTGIWSAGNGYGNPGSHAGVFRGPANASYGWLSNEAVTPGPNSSYAFTWEGSAVTGVGPGDVVDTARIAARPAAGGDYYRIMFHVAVDEPSDLSVALTGPTALEVPASGSEATYVATVSNGGTETAVSSKVKFQLPATATHMSSVAGTSGDACVFAGTQVTCTIANLANGGSRTFTVVVKYQTGVGGLALPATANVTATTSLLRDGTTDPVSSNDTATAATSLTTVATTTSCPDGQVLSATNTCVSTTTTTTTKPTPTTSKPKPTSGTDRYRGDDGKDRFNGGSGGDYFSGRGGNDRFSGGNGPDTGFGGPGNDLLFGGNGNDRVSGGSGNDSVFGGRGNDSVFGGPGNDLISGGPGDDTVRGGSGDDRVFCGTSTDRAYGDAGDDFIGCSDGVGGDKLLGGRGADTCVGDPGDTFVSCERIIVRRARA